MAPRFVHHYGAQRMKARRWQLLGEHVRNIIVRAHVRDSKLHRLDHISYVEMSTRDVLRPFVVLRVI